MSSVITQQDDVLEKPPEALAVWHWPLLQTGWKGVGFMAILLSVFLVVQFQTNQTGMAAVSLLAVLTVTVWFWFPIYYVFDKNGIKRKLFGVPQRIPWARIQDFKPTTDGIRLIRQGRSAHSTNSLFISWNKKRVEIERIVSYYSARTPKRRHGSSSFSVHLSS